MSGSTALVGRAGIVPNGPHGMEGRAGLPGGATSGGGGAGAGAGAVEGGGGGGKRSFPHIDDITRVAVEVDAHSPIDSVLTTAENYLRQAESAKNFGRPDVALKDYIRASIIAVERIKQNKDWVRLQGDDRGLLTRHQRVLQRVRDLHGEFDAIKVLIKADNVRSGVRRRAGEAQVRGDEAEGALGNGGTNTKVKPAVSPKPKALHGKALVPKGNATASGQDLATRFAGLRTSAKNGMALETTLADMPRVPDAIYSPARGTLSETAELPSSASHDLFPRPPSNCGPKTMAAFHDCFVPSHSFGSAKTATDERPAIPTGNTISPHILVQLMSRGAANLAILLIDIRTRAEFDQGHIMSQATICVEPDILSRDDISANEIENSMVLAPQSEHELFEKRHKFDLIVMYDQDTEVINFRPSLVEDKAVLGLFNALGQYDFPGKQQYIKLLSGGMAAWTSVMGRSAVQPSSGREAKPPMLVSSKPLGARPRYQARPIQNPEVVSRWERSIAEFDATPIVSSTEDVLRRFPSIATQESMFSPVRADESSHALGARYPKLPAPPSRPPPAVARRTYSGLSDTRASLVGARAPVAMSTGKRPRRVGLVNMGATCYVNSTLQALFATPRLGKLLSSGHWLVEYGQVPKKAGEALGNPQLMCKMLQNLFMFLDAGRNECINPETFMEYVQSICSSSDRRGAASFDTKTQADASEFWVFMKDIVHDETNLCRALQSYTASQHTKEEGLAITAARIEWDRYRAVNNSIFDRFFKFTYVTTLQCTRPACQATSYLPVHEDTLILNWTGPLTGRQHVSLEEMLQIWSTPEIIEGATCDKCRKGGRSRMDRLARLPDRLVISFSRFYQEKHTYNKLMSRVDFPVRGLDLKPYMVDRSEEEGGRDGRHDVRDPANHFSAELKYDLYAVIQHRGSSLKSGHYVAYVKDDQMPWSSDSWCELNDRDPTPLDVSDSNPEGVKLAFSDPPDNTVYMLFYARQGTF